MMEDAHGKVPVLAAGVDGTKAERTPTCKSPMRRRRQKEYITNDWVSPISVTVAMHYYGGRRLCG